jgi:RNA polymerase sigma-70 factor (ECF subfamily)
LRQAHAADGDARRAAQAELLARYCAPVYRYLRGRAGSDAAAEDLCQEFALRFLRGDFRHADPARGRFRHYLRTALQHLAGEQSRRRPQPKPLPPDDDRLADVPAPADDGGAFLELWRAELLDRTWAALAADEPAYEVLRLKADDPARPAAALAEELGRRHGRAVTADGVRQALHRARAKFADLLRAEVAASVPTDDPAEVNAELADLGLLVYCPSGPGERGQ